MNPNLLTSYTLWFKSSLLPVFKSYSLWVQTWICRIWLVKQIQIIVYFLIAKIISISTFNFGTNFVCLRLRYGHGTMIWGPFKYKKLMRLIVFSEFSLMLDQPHEACKALWCYKDYLLRNEVRNCYSCVPGLQKRSLNLKIKIYSKITTITR